MKRELFKNEETKSYNSGRAYQDERGSGSGSTGSKFEKYEEIVNPNIKPLKQINPIINNTNIINPKIKVATYTDNESITSPNFMHNYNRVTTQESNSQNIHERHVNNKISFLKHKNEAKTNYTFDNGYEMNQNQNIDDKPQYTDYNSNSNINSNRVKLNNNNINPIKQESYSPNPLYNSNNNDINELTIKSYYQENNTNQSNSKINNLNNQRYRNTNSDDMLSTLSAMNNNVNIIINIILLN